MEITIDTKRFYSKKDTADDIKNINKRMSNNIEDLTIDEFIQRAGNEGYTFARAVLSGGTKAENFVKQILLGLDFDCDMEINVIKRYCEEYRLPYLFTYKTLSWKPTENRLRAVFLMDHWIENPELAKAANCMLAAIFSDSDKSCTNISRLFYGGKGVMDINLNARVNIVDLARATESYYKWKKKDNYVRDLARFGKKAGINVEAGRLCIFNVSEFTIEERDDVIIDNGVVMIPYKEGNKSYEKSVEGQKMANLPVLTTYEGEALCKLCPLLSDFVNGEDIHHELKFLLATSLIRIKGGKELFLDSLTGSYEKWKSDLKKYIPSYYPMECCKSKIPCPYYESCEAYSLYDKASRKIRKLANKEDFYEIEKCEIELKGYLEDAVNSEDSDIHVIKAQTALGKTEQYARLISARTDKKFIIAVPTIQLQHEIARRIEAYGVKCEITESIYTKATQLHITGLTKKLNRAFSLGFAKRAKKIIREFKYEHLEELSLLQLEQIDHVLKKQEIGYSGARCIVTTHALFLLKELYRLQDYEIIIDEDLLMTLFHLTNNLSVPMVRKLIESPLIGSWNQEQLRKILELGDEETLQVNFERLSETAIDNLYWRKNEFIGPVPKLFESTHVIMRKGRKEIIFMRKNNFLDCAKMTILSATVDRELYRDYFSEKNIIFREVHKAAYKGKLIQYTAHSLSRIYFKKNGMMDIVKEIQEKYCSEDISIISFKMLFPNSEIHFGKTEGFNTYRGKNIAVIGTPHNSPVLYKLVGAMLGYRTSGSLHKYRVVRNDYSYPMMTYENDKMQNLQLFFIESELEQAIGRARLLREECTVYVFSNYPCQQAELIQDSYLELNAEADTEQAEDDIAKNEDEIIENETMDY